MYLNLCSKITDKAGENAGQAKYHLAGVLTEQPYFIFI